MTRASRPLFSADQSQALNAAPPSRTLFCDGILLVEAQLQTLSLPKYDPTLSSTGSRTVFVVQLMHLAQPRCRQPVLRGRKKVGRYTEDRDGAEDDGRVVERLAYNS